jgi:hypothetical protein
MASKSKLWNPRSARPFLLSGPGISGFGIRVLLTLTLVVLLAAVSHATSVEEFFRLGTEAYRAGDYARSAHAFAESAAQQPASGTLQNLGNAEWHSGRAGLAVLAWEQALWLDPFQHSSRQNLRFARKAAQLEAPELAWYEVVSTWLPANWWAWLAGATFWLGVGMATLPGILRRRKTVWHQAVAAVAFMLFLLSVPAYVGVHTRSGIGFILQKDTPLRLTPTADAQAVTRLAAGEPARLVRQRGAYVLVRTHRTLGWVQRAQFGLTCAGVAGL